MRFRVGMVGLGKLGLPCADVFARHHDVVGFDPARRKQRHHLPRAHTGSGGHWAVPTAHEPAYGGAKPTAHLTQRDFDYGLVRKVIGQIDCHVSASQLVVLIRYRTV